MISQDDNEGAFIVPRVGGSGKQRRRAVASLAATTRVVASLELFNSRGCDSPIYCGSSQTPGVTESAYCSRYCTYLMVDVSYLGSTIVALFILPCTFLNCYSFLLGYLFL